MDQSETASRISAQAFEQLARERVPFSAMLDFTVTAIARGRITLVMPFAEHLIRPGGTIAGPAMMALADLAMYGLVMSCLGEVEMAVTSQFSMHFLRRPAARAMRIEGAMLRLGRRLAVGDCRLYSEGEADPVAQATITYALPPEAPNR